MTCGCGHQKDEHHDGVCQERGCGCVAFVPLEPPKEMPT